MAWNPWLSTDCDKTAYAGLERADKRPVCVGVGGTSTKTSSSSPSTSTTMTPTATATSTTKNTTTPTTTTSSTPPKPTPPAPTQAGIAEDCKTYHVAKEGDGCWAIANQYSIPHDQFYKWNPAVGNDCAGLWLGYAYCVKA